MELVERGWVILAARRIWIGPFCGSFYFRPGDCVSPEDGGDEGAVFVSSGPFAGADFGHNLLGVGAAFHCGWVSSQECFAAGLALSGPDWLVRVQHFLEVSVQLFGSFAVSAEDGAAAEAFRVEIQV